ncbi:MAG: FKBP-type peptidyl-prolyl cis-trans isomerase [Parachlamydiales bacterium]|nr:FKBP-type peptidyl-prolyl cis-trans isomerase [Parachlamydiales bacterium]
MTIRDFLKSSICLPLLAVGATAFAPVWGDVPSKQPAQVHDVKDSSTKIAVASSDLQDQSKSNEDTIDVSRVSEAFGHLIVTNLENPGFHFNIDAIIKGMKDAVAGLPSPMTEDQYEKAITSIQEKIFSEMASRNMSEANAFLDKNRREAGIVVVEEGKLQYRVTQPGQGKEVPQDGTPLITYTGRYLDGTVFGSSQESGAPVTLPLDRTIPGFRKGLVGMKEGEKRTLYIHPDLAYGMSGHLPPNSLLVFEIEVIEANREVATSDDAKTPDASATEAIR